MQRSRRVPAPGGRPAGTDDDRRGCGIAGRRDSRRLHRTEFRDRQRKKGQRRNERLFLQRRQYAVAAHIRTAGNQAPADRRRIRRLQPGRPDGRRDRPAVLVRRRKRRQGRLLAPAAERRSRQRGPGRPIRLGPVQGAPRLLRDRQRTRLGLLPHPRSGDPRLPLLPRQMAEIRRGRHDRHPRGAVHGPEHGLQLPGLGSEKHELRRKLLDSELRPRPERHRPPRATGAAQLRGDSTPTKSRRPGR